MAGTVTTSNSSITRGFVRATYALTVRAKPIFWDRELAADWEMVSVDIASMVPRLAVGLTAVPVMKSQGAIER